MWFTVKQVTFVGNQNPKLATEANCFFYEHLDCDDRSMEPFTHQH